MPSNSNDHSELYVITFACWFMYFAPIYFIWWFPFVLIAARFGDLFGRCLRILIEKGLSLFCLGFRRGSLGAARQWMDWLSWRRILCLRAWWEGFCCSFRQFVKFGRMRALCFPFGAGIQYYFAQVATQTSHDVIHRIQQRWKRRIESSVFPNVKFLTTKGSY